MRDVFALGPEIGWDDALPDELKKKWVAKLSMFIAMGDIALSRSVKPEKTDGLPELIGFGEGSLIAYGFAIYVRWKKVKKEITDPDEYLV